MDHGLLVPIHMREELRCMYAGIGTAAACSFNRLAQNDGKGFVQQFLHSYRVGLQLPAVIIGAFICQFNKITLLVCHSRKVNIPQVNGYP